MACGINFTFLSSIVRPLIFWGGLYVPMAFGSNQLQATKKAAPATEIKTATSKFLLAKSKKIPENSLEAPILATIDKTSQYLQQETLAGGQAAEEQTLVLNTIRRSAAANGEYERLVLDFKNSHSDDIGLAPSYFSIRHRKIAHKDLLQIQISGTNVDAQLEESLKKTYHKPGLFSKNPSLILFPAPAKEVIILLEINSKTQFEAFQLSNPGRIVLDLRG